MTKGKPLSSEDINILKKMAEQIVLSDSLPSIREVESTLAQALSDSCKPGLDEAERLRLQAIVELARTYIELVTKQVNYMVNCYAVLKNGC